MRVFLFVFLAFILASCVNKNGLHSSYYSECKEYYDVLGVYHKKCKNDILNIDEFMQ